MFFFSSISGYRLRNFEIRVGQDGKAIGHNAISHKQLRSVPDGATVNFSCPQDLYGTWVSVNKSDTWYFETCLQLMELCVFGYACKSNIREQNNGAATLHFSKSKQPYHIIDILLLLHTQSFIDIKLHQWTTTSQNVCFSRFKIDFRVRYFYCMRQKTQLSLFHPHNCKS